MAAGPRRFARLHRRDGGRGGRVGAAGLRPRWAFALVAVAALLALGSVSGQAWFVVPFGGAWIVLGVTSIAVGRSAGSRGMDRVSLAVAAGAIGVLVVGLVASGLPARLANRAPSVPPRTASLPLMHVVVDTDMLGDDWMAILYLLSEPAVDVQAIAVEGTSAMGCEAASDAARRLLAVAGVAAFRSPVARTIRWPGATSFHRRGASTPWPGSRRWACRRSRLRPSRAMPSCS